MASSRHPRRRIRAGQTESSIFWCVPSKVWWVSSRQLEEGRQGQDTNEQDPEEAQHFVGWAWGGHGEIQPSRGGVLAGCEIQWLQTEVSCRATNPKLAGVWFPPTAQSEYLLFQTKSNTNKRLSKLPTKGCPQKPHYSLQFSHSKQGRP